MSTPRLSLIGLTALTLVTLGAGAGRTQTETPWNGPPNWMRELRYDGVPGRQMSNRVEYYVKMAKADEQGKSGRMRWVDRAIGRPLMIAFIPAYKLEEFDTRAGSGPLMTAAFSAEEWQATARAAAEDGTETEVLRRFRNDLSLNRDRHIPSRRGLTLYTEVSVAPGMSWRFERVLKRALEAYAKVAPDTIISTMETVFGQPDGPDYALMQPFGSGNGTYGSVEAYESMHAAVAEAFGEREADAWSENLAAAVTAIDHLMLRRAAPDTFVP